MISFVEMKIVFFLFHAIENVFRDGVWVGWAALAFMDHFRFSAGGDFAPKGTFAIFSRCIHLWGCVYIYILWVHSNSGPNYSTHRSAPTQKEFFYLKCQ
jgi:hypothetical protein